MKRRRLAWTSAVALLLGLILAPRPPSSEPGPDALRDPVLSRAARLRAHSLVFPRSSPTLGAIAPPILRARERRGAPGEVGAPPEEAPPPAIGYISGHVVDGNGLPVGGAILHVHGVTGSEAHRIADDGEFQLSVAAGVWTVEAGWFDGEDEWRSVPATANIVPGATATLAMEILLNGAGHAVHAGLREAMGMGWEIRADDGPLRKGDVLVEVEGQILTDLQPEAVRAALRERPGETLRAMILRPDGTGDYSSVSVVLEAR